MRYTELLETTTTDLLYHWTTVSKAITAINRDSLQSRKWKHYIESEDKMFQGSSWCDDQYRWQSDNVVCFVIDRKMLKNQVYAINGNRVYLQTRGILNPSLYDPNAYKYEDTHTTEHFVVGSINNLRSIIVKIITNDDTVIELAQSHNIVTEQK